MVAGGRLDLTVGRADRPAGAGLLVSAGGYSAQHCPCWPADPGLTDWLLLLASLVDQDYGRGQHYIPYHSWPSSAPRPSHANITFPWKCADIPLVRLGKLPCWLLLSIIPPCAFYSEQPPCHPLATNPLLERILTLDAAAWHPALLLVA